MAWIQAIQGLLIMIDTRNVIDKYKNMTVEDIRQNLQAKSMPVSIAIENIEHDFNIGSIVRSANAFNVSSVHIIGKKHWNRRGAMATEKYLSLFHHRSIDEFKEWAQHNSAHIIGIDNVEGSVGLMKFEFPKNSILVFGQEGPGLSEEMKELAESLVAIEQYGSTRSVNVGAAAAIVMYEWVRRYENQ